MTNIPGLFLKYQWQIFPSAPQAEMFSSGFWFCSTWCSCIFTPSLIGMYAAQNRHKVLVPYKKLHHLHTALVDSQTCFRTSVSGVLIWMGLSGINKIL